MKRHVILLALSASVLSFALSKIEMRSLDLFFLDWKQILASGRPETNPVKIIDISGLKPDETSPTAKISRENLLEVVRQLSMAEPKAIILTLSGAEVESDPNSHELASGLSSYPNLYILQSSGFQSLVFDKQRSQIPLNFPLAITRDSQVDDVSRRILVYLDIDRKVPNPDFKFLPNILGPMQPLATFETGFKYVETWQVFLKIWPWFDFDKSYLSSDKLDPKLLTEVRGKIVLLDTHGIYAINSKPSILRRLPWITSGDLEGNFWPAGNLVATYITNYLFDEHVREPSTTSKVLWMFVGLFLILSSITLGSVTRAWGLSSLVIFSYVLLGFILFRFGSYNFDSGKVLLSGIGFQYIVLPYRYLRLVRKLDYEKFKTEKKADRERSNRKVLVKVAKANLALKVAAKVSHDLRGPLMALQVTSALIKGKVSDDLESLIRDSTVRIGHIADETLQLYKHGSRRQTIEDVNVKDVTEDLIKSYRQLYPQLNFIINVFGEPHTKIPFYSLQRALSNILNNAIEAHANEIQASLKEDDGNIFIIVSNNGAPVPLEIRTRLFEEKATFGKNGGTGLGLYQVRTEIESHGGTVTFDSRAAMTTFTIQIPKVIRSSSLNISGVNLVLDSDSEVAQQLSRRYHEAQIIHKTSVDDAWSTISEYSDTSVLTLLIDITFDDNSETSLELLEKVRGKTFKKVILYCSMVENPEIQQLAKDFRAVLIDKSDLIFTF